jgi:hypothetical protein
VAEKLCHCGKPLHYNSEVVQAQVEQLVETLGEFMDVTVGGVTYSVPRHYIALHGLKGSELQRLGFKQVS